MHKDKVLAMVHGEFFLTDIAKHAPVTLHRIIDLAFLQPEEMNRWHVYERLKAIAKGVAGYESRHAELSSSGHYEALIAFIDRILPREGDPIERGWIESGEYKQGSEEEEW